MVTEVDVVCCCACVMVAGVMQAQAPSLMFLRLEVVAELAVVEWLKMQMAIYSR